MIYDMLNSRAVSYKKLLASPKVYHLLQLYPGLNASFLFKVANYPSLGQYIAPEQIKVNSLIGTLGGHSYFLGMSNIYLVKNGTKNPLIIYLCTQGSLVSYQKLSDL